jgi:hypothetical protein
MQPAPPPAHRLHWSPVAPSWIVSGGLILLAAMPHKIPAHARAFVRQPLGFLLAAAAAAWLFTKHAVLGVAALLLIVSIPLHGSVEGFANPPIFIKDVVAKKKDKRQWFDENMLAEEPHMIQERTDDSTLLHDEVSPEERAVVWYDEEVLDEHPAAIQERALGETDRYPEY